MKLYKLTKSNIVLKLVNNIYSTSIPNNPTNKDWQEYQNWLSEGNIPNQAESLEELYNRNITK